MAEGRYFPRDLSFQGKYYPMTGILTYLAVGFSLFLVAPFNWYLENRLLLTIYFGAILAVFILGFSRPVSGLVRPAREIPYKFLILAGTIMSVALVVPAVQLYSGKYPWQFMELLRDQSEAYTVYQERLRLSTQSDRAPVAIVRTLLHPIVFSALPLTIVHWRDLSWVYRGCAAIVVACLLLVSLARGTDRETFDILIFMSAGWLVAHFRARNAGQNVRTVRAKKKGVAIFASLLAAIAIAFFVFFVERKLGRYDGKVDMLCIGYNTNICILNTAFGNTWLGDWGVFALGITSSYMSQGYYGLNLAMSLDFQSTWGTGWSPLAARAYEAFSGDSTMYALSYTYRMRAMGWSDEYSWSTLMVWWANDVGFIGALFVLLFFSMMMGASWRDAVLGRDDRAAVVFVMLFLMFVYLPANNQIGQTLDLLFAFCAWVAAWQLGRIGGGRAVSARPAGNRHQGTIYTMPYKRQL